MVKMSSLWGQIIFAVCGRPTFESLMLLTHTLFQKIEVQRTRTPVKVMLTMQVYRI
jgi:hypothetical protein